MMHIPPLSYWYLNRRRKQRATDAVRISVAVEALDDQAQVSDKAGQASLSGVYTGTPVWALADDASGKYAINSADGEITVADTLVAGADQIIVSVSGIDPLPEDVAVNIVVED